MTSRTLVVGASDGIGALVANQLLGKGHRVRGLTRDPAGKKASSPAMEWAGCDLGSGEVPEGLFEGINQAFFLAPNESGDAFPALKALIGAAQAANVSRVVMMTGLGPDDGESSRFRLAEAELKRSGIPHAVLRPNWFMQSFSRYWAEEIKYTGRLSVPAADARISFIDARDIADCAVQLLGRHDKTASTYVLTGSEALSMAEVMEQLSGATGRSLSYQSVGEEDFREALLSVGLCSEMIKSLVALFREVREGHTAAVSGDVETILGRPPRRFAGYAMEHRADWIAE